MNQKKRYKPFYKKILRLRENIQDRPKVFKFNKQKWKRFQQAARKQLKFYKRYRIKDQFQLFVPKFVSRGNSFQKRFRNTLRERKIFSFFYGILKKKYLKTHLTNSILKSKQNKLRFNTYKQRTLEFFESRLDTIIYRSKFSLSMKSAGQLILHGHILINGDIVRTKSYQVKNNDLIEVYPTLKSRDLIKKSIDRSNFWPVPPKHLIINYKTFQIIFISHERYTMVPIFNHYLNITSLLSNIKKY